MTEYAVYRADTTMVAGYQEVLERRSLRRYDIVEADTPKQALREVVAEGNISQVSNHPLTMDKFQAVVIATSNIHGFVENRDEEFSEIGHEKGKHRKYHVFQKDKENTSFRTGLGAGKHPALAAKEITEKDGLKLGDLTATDSLVDADWIVFHPSSLNLFKAEAFEPDLPKW